MAILKQQRMALAVSLALGQWALGVSAQAQTNTSTSPDPTAQLQTVQVVGARQRLDAARNGLSPDTGSSVYKFGQGDIANLPQGEGTALNQVVLQSPGVVQDSYGQLHVRGDHGNVQYRINGVVIPEAISGFGQALEARFAERIDILTGALPAQYGYRTAGVVDIKTKGVNQHQASSLALSLGANSQRQLEAETGGNNGALNYYATGSWMASNLGIENPTASRSALHDHTLQNKGFGYLSYVINDDSRVNLMLGTSSGHFQIPDVAGRQPDASQFASGALPFAAPNSATLDAHQQERNRFEILSYQSTLGPSVDYQLSAFQRYTDVHYRPDPLGDLLYHGVAADILHQNTAVGTQADLSWRWNEQHTVRLGLIAQAEKYAVTNQSAVFALSQPTDPNSAWSGSVQNIVDQSGLRGHLAGFYGQDEWQLSPSLVLNYGARYDRVNTVVQEQQFSPRLGVVYDWSKETRWHAGYARYFTPPPTEQITTTSVQKFLGTSNALPSDANTAVKSERSHYFDVGFSHQASPEWIVGADAYLRQVRHLQDDGQFGNALIYSAFNYAQGRVYGLELSATYRSKSLSAYLNVASARAQARSIETGQFNFAPDEINYIAQHWIRLDHDQALTVSGGLTYQASAGWVLGADALYGSGLRLTPPGAPPNSGHLPGYLTLNLSARKTLDLLPGLGKMEWRLSLDNVLDRVYQLRDGTGVGVGAPQFGARRQLALSVEKTF